MEESIEENLHGRTASLFKTRNLSYSASVSKHQRSFNRRWWKRQATEKNHIEEVISPFDLDADKEYLKLIRNYCVFAAAVVDDDVLDESPLFTSRESAAEAAVAATDKTTADFNRKFYLPSWGLESRDALDGS